MRSDDERNGRRKLTWLAAGAAMLFAASPVRAQDTSLPARSVGQMKHVEGSVGSPAAVGLNIAHFDQANVPIEVMEAMQA